MSEWIEILKDFSIENIGILILISFVVISAASSYIQLLYASQFEGILMNKNEESKRFFIGYIIIFFFLGITNYLLTMNGSLFLLTTGFLVLASISSFILWVLNKLGKAKRVYWWSKEKLNLVTFMTSVVVFVFMASTFLNINHLSLVILGALVEVLGIALVFLNASNIKTSITVTIKGEKWYVFKRIDEKYLLCGDNCRIDDSTKTKLIEIESIVNDNICFEKEI